MRIIKKILAVLWSIIKWIYVILTCFCLNNIGRDIDNTLRRHGFIEGALIIIGACLIYLSPYFIYKRIKRINRNKREGQSCDQ